MACKITLDDSRKVLRSSMACIADERNGQNKGDVPMKKVSMIAVCLFFVLGPGALICRNAAASDPTDEQMISNAEFMARHESEGAAPDVVLPPDTDLTQFTRDYLGLAPEAYVAPLIIPAADGNSDSLGSPYFFSFGSGMYMYSTNTGCHMAPAYIPNSRSGVTVTVDNFFVFALDNNVSVNTTYFLWRKNTLDTSNAEIMGTVTTSESSTGIQIIGDTSIDNPVTSREYTYYVTWCFNGTDQSTAGFWIYYTES
jgi:hypothetical protein